MGHDQSSEVVFDVTKPAEGLVFLGLLDSVGTSDNRLTGLFAWRCQGCGASNKDVAIVESQQAFLTRWSCSRCEKTVIVRFRARASADWVAGHTLAITGKDLCHLAEDDPVAYLTPAEEQARGSAGQRAFAWVAIPALLALVFLGLSDIRRPPVSSASAPKEARAPHQSTALSRLLGHWVSEEGGDRLYFVHIDAASRMGTYVQFSQNRRPGCRVWFDVIHEDSKGEQLIIRRWSEPADGSKANRSPAAAGSEATVYIPRHGASLTWIDIQGGSPTLKVYHRLDSSPDS